MYAISRKFVLALLLCPLTGIGQERAAPGGAHGPGALEKQSRSLVIKKDIPIEKKATVDYDKSMVPSTKRKKPACPTCGTVQEWQGATGAAPLVSSGASAASSTSAGSDTRTSALCKSAQNYFNTITGKCLNKGEVALSGAPSSWVPSAEKLPPLCQTKVYYNTLTKKCLSSKEVALE